MLNALSSLPGVVLLRTYQRPWLRTDLLAAITVWALLVPQALAYAQLAQVEAVVGLYAVIGATLGYVLLGGVRTMSVGPEATIALLTASIVAPLALGDSARYLALAATLALMAGAWLVLAGLLRLGFITRFLSRPLLMGYVAGSAVVMIVSQVDSLLGISLVAQDDTVAEAVEIVRRLPETNLATLLTGLLVIATVVGIQRLDRRLPAYLMGVIVAIVLSAVLGLEARGVAVVGAIQPGLPSFGLPSMTVADLLAVAGPALGMALLVFADSGVTGQVLGRRGGYRVDGNQEFLGLGAANIGAALTSGFPVNGSQSRSFTALDVGARSQLMNLAVLGLVLLTLVLLTPLFAPLPKPALAAVILVVAFGLLDADGFRILARVDRNEVALALLTAAIVIGVGMLAGVIVTVVLSLFLVAIRASQPNRTVLTRVPGTDAFRGTGSRDAPLDHGGLIVYRFDAPLVFANAQLLADDINALVEQPEELRVRWVVLDAEGISEVDSTAAAMLVDLATELRERDVVLALARVKATVRDYLERAGLLAVVPADRIYLEVDDAADAYAQQAAP